MTTAKVHAELDYPLAGAIPARQSSPSLAQPSRREDLREQRRARTLLSGKIIYGDGLISPDCVIHNLSPGGARVRVPSIDNLPKTFGLLFIKGALLFDATVIWRRRDAYGLSFSGRHDLSGDFDPAYRRAHSLWLELIQR